MAHLGRLSSTRPDKHTNRVAWNECWEKDLQSFNCQLTISRLANRPRSVEWHQAEEILVAQTRLHFDRLTQEFLNLQENIRSFALPRLVQGGFEEKWKSLSDSQRQDIALDGLFNACDVSDEMESHRQWCPEATRRGMTGEHGQTFLEMLLVIVEHAATNTEPIYFPHAVVDILFRSGSCRLLAPRWRLHRSYFLGLTVWQMLLSFYGLVQQAFIMKTPRQSRDQRDIVRAALKDINVDEGMNRVTGTFARACWSCGKGEAESDQAFKACSKCKAIGRTIRYCSSACQKHDWKYGRPRPHKMTCGKEQLEPLEPGVIVESQKPSIIPPPVPPFKRTLALQYQVSLLEEGGEDYVIMRPGTGTDVAIDVEVPELRVMFLVARQQAFQTGCPRAVALMYHILQSCISDLGVSQSDLRKQLEEEFEIQDLSAIDINDPMVPTEEELKNVAALVFPGSVEKQSSLIALYWKEVWGVGE